MTDPASLAHDPARHEHAARLAACPNCDTAFQAGVEPPRFCPHCGQETTLHPPSVHEFVHEFIGHYVALEGPLWSSLRLLLLAPGRLTREYLGGRRRRYVLPLRLYLSASFLFFVAFKALSYHEEPAARAAEEAATSPPAASAPDTTRYRTVVISAKGIEIASAASSVGRRATEQRLDEACGPAASQACGWFERRSVAASRHWMADPKAASATFGARWLKTAPYAVFLMLPVFAAILALAYRSRRMLFGEHLVFSLHMHTLWFIMGLVSVLSLYALAPWLAALVPVYVVLALRTAYGGRWWTTLLRAAVILLAYAILLIGVSGLLWLALFIE
jgi:hypothetical protein